MLFQRKILLISHLINLSPQGRQSHGMSKKQLSSSDAARISPSSPHIQCVTGNAITKRTSSPSDDRECLGGSLWSSYLICCCCWDRHECSYWRFNDEHRLGRASLRLAASDGSKSELSLTETPGCFFVNGFCRAGLCLKMWKTKQSWHLDQNHLRTMSIKIWICSTCFPRKCLSFLLWDFTCSKRNVHCIWNLFFFREPLLTESACLDICEALN